MAADTDIELRPVFSTNGIKSSARNLRKEIENIFDVSAGKKMDSQMQSLMSKMSKLAGQSREVAKEMDALANKKIPTEQYTEATNRVEQLQKAVENADEKWQQLEAIGAKQSSIQQWVDKANYFEEKLKEAQADVQRLEEEGKAFTFGSGTEEMQKLEETQKNLYNEMTVTVNKAYELDPALKNAASGGKSLQSSMGTISKAAESVAKALGKVAGTAIHKGLDKLKSKFTQLTSGIKGTGKALGGLNFKQILGSVIGIRSLYSAFGKLKQAIIEGTNNLAKWHGGNNEVNKSLSELKSSLTQLKNAWGAAFAPILNAVAPALQKLINLCIEAANAIGMLTSRISGKSTFIKAKKVNEDYAKSLGGVGGAAADAADKLAAFDDLDVLGENKGGGGGGSGIEDMFEEVPVEPFSLKDWLAGIDWDSIKSEAEKLGRKLADILNGVFADEELAALLGKTIGEMINTAIHFAYGFVDELDWLQMGHWLGTLVKTGIETIEWDLLGKTIALALNGIADTIIGFFDRYPVGLLGSSIATMFNNAIEWIDPVKIGTAIGDVIGAPIAEFTSFLRDADIAQATQKAFTLFETILTGKLFGGDKTLGTIIGEGLGAAVNAAIDILIHADIQGAVDAIGQFFNDIFNGAADEIDATGLGEAMIKLAMDLGSLVIDLVAGVLDGIGYLLDIFDKEAGEILHNAADDSRDTWKQLTEDVMNDVEAGAFQIKNAAEVTNLALEKNGWTMTENGQILKETTGEFVSLEEWQAAVAEATSEAMVSANDRTADSIDRVGQASQEMATASAGDFHQLDQAASDTAASVSGSMNNMESSISGSTGSSTEYIRILGDTMDSNLGEVKDYETQTTGALDRVSGAAETTDANIQGLGDTVSTQLEIVTETIDVWYQNIMETYFSYDAWSTVFTEGMLLALQDGLALFQETWDTTMTAWMTSAETQYFNSAKWKTNWDHFLTEFKTMWTTFSNQWTTSMTTWMTTNETKYFAQSVWQKFGKNMEDGLYGGMKGIVSKVGQLVNAMISMFNTACSQLATAMNNLISSYNTAASVVGAPSIPSISYSPVSSVAIPALAQGAVIPPNKEFLAVLGDQRSGTNIEAPLDTIKQAFEDVVANMEVQNTGYTEMQLDGETFARLIVPYVISELGRSGYNVEVLEA